MSTKPKKRNINLFNKSVADKFTQKIKREREMERFVDDKGNFDAEKFGKEFREKNKIKKEQERNQIGCSVIPFFLIIIFILIS